MPGRIVFDHYNIKASIIGIADYVSALPSPTEAWRGKLLYKYGGTSVADELYICRKEDDDSYYWYTIDLTVVP